MWQPTVFTFCTHKKGEPESTCEDSADSKLDGTGNGVFAVADGATRSFYSRLWAEQLTHHFTAEPDQAISQWEEWLKKPRDIWLKGLKECVEKRGDDIYLANSYYERRPAAATFAGLRLHRMNEDGVIAWDGLVLGDSCLFHLRSSGEVCRYLKQRAADFSFITESAQSYPKTPSHLPKLIRSSLTTQAEPDQPAAAQEGDAFLLATDALSKWMLSRAEAGEPVWGTVAQLDSEQKAHELVAAAREDATHRLENDDVALIVVRFGSPHHVFKDQKYESKPMKRPAEAQIGEEKGHQPAKSPSSLPVGPAPAVPPEPGNFARDLLLKSLACLVVLLGLSLLGNVLLYKKTQRLQRHTEALQRNVVRAEDFSVLRHKAASLHGMVEHLSSTANDLSNKLDRLGHDLRGALNKVEKGDVAAGSKNGLKADSTEVKGGAAPTP